MMMPGVELARKRKIHHRHEVATGPSDSSQTARPSSLRPPAPTRMAEPAILARIRLEEKLQGLSIGTIRRNPSSSPSSSSPSTSTPSTLTPSPVVRQIRHTGGDGNQRVGAVSQLNPEAANISNIIHSPSAMKPIPVSAIQANYIHKSNSIRRLLRSNSGLDLCAVCLEEIQVSGQRITWLPCSHKYHSDCVLPWLTTHSHCPYCRTRVPPLFVLPK